MRVAFVKFAGLAAGGCEKYLQTIAAVLSSSGIDVDYYYTNAAPYINWNSPFKHPDNDDSRKQFLEKHGVNVKKIFIESKDGTGPPYDWINTDFWDHFNENDYDVISTARAGYPEYPFTKINKVKIIDTIHSFEAEDKENIHKVILLSEWQSQQWVRRGGNPNKVVIIPSLVEVPSVTDSNLRAELSIPEDAFVYGFHQGNRDDIFSPVALEAFGLLNDKNSYFVIMGGSGLHRRLANATQLTNVRFVEFSSDMQRIHDFLQTLDVYAHARRDGEVCSACIIEALYHGLPVISHPGLNMGHVEQIAGAGIMVDTVRKYSQALSSFRDNKALLKDYQRAALKKYNDLYDYEKIKKDIIKTYTEL